MMLLVALAGCIGADLSGLDGTRDAPAGLEAPPDLEVGQWWTIEAVSALDGAVHTGTFVVTDRTNDTASFGMTSDTFDHVFFILHLPPLGVVDLSTFSWNVMGHGFDALSFPLQEGKEWETVFHGREYGWDVKAEVTKVEGQRAMVEMIGDNVLIKLTYDAGIGMISEMDAQGYGVRYEVKEHGFGYEGPVKTPLGIDLGFFEGRFGVLNEMLQPGVPFAEVGVSKGVPHGTLAFLVSGIADAGPPGVFHAKATAPDGTVFEHTFTPMPDEPRFLTELYGHDAVEGTWQLELAGLGAGLVAAELIVYDLVESVLTAQS